MATDTIITLGRRKTSVARLRMTSGKGSITVNKKALEEYFPTDALQREANSPFVLTETNGKFDVKINVKGGGVSGQAGAVRHAIARALLEVDAELRPSLKKAGFLTRDPRMVERKKPGQKKARKKFQFSKR